MDVVVPRVAGVAGPTTRRKGPVGAFHALSRDNRCAVGTYLAPSVHLDAGAVKRVHARSVVFVRPGPVGTPIAPEFCDVAEVIVAPRGRENVAFGAGVYHVPRKNGWCAHRLISLARDAFPVQKKGYHFHSHRALLGRPASTVPGVDRDKLSRLLITKNPSDVVDDCGAQWGGDAGLRPDPPIKCFARVARRTNSLSRPPLGQQHPHDHQKDENGRSHRYFG